MIMLAIEKMVMFHVNPYKIISIALTSSQPIWRFVEQKKHPQIPRILNRRGDWCLTHPHRENIQTMMIAALLFMSSNGHYICIMVINFDVSLPIYIMMVTIHDNISQPIDKNN